MSLEREGRAENSPLNMPLLSGDRLRTRGRARRSALRRRQHAAPRHALDDRRAVGRTRPPDRRPPAAQHPRAGADASRTASIPPPDPARITQPGEYRIALAAAATGEIQLEVAVVRGAAEVFTDRGSTPVRAGERAYASAGLAPVVRVCLQLGELGRLRSLVGSAARRAPRRVVAVPAGRHAGLCAGAGRGRRLALQQSYGYAWYPRVAADWRPYYYGRWASYPRYGWTWIGADRFAWPTHHYGRWGFSAGVWFWIPSSRWAPAYVSWAYAPGYVSWCPLGFDNRPVIGDQCLSRRARLLLAVARLDGRVVLALRRPRPLRQPARRELGPLRSRPAPARSRRARRRPASRATSRSPRNSTPIRWAGIEEPVRAKADAGRDDTPRPALATRGRRLARRRARPRASRELVARPARDRTRARLAISIAATRSSGRGPSGRRRAPDCAVPRSRTAAQATHPPPDAVRAGRPAPHRPRLRASSRAPSPAGAERAARAPGRSTAGTRRSAAQSRRRRERPAATPRS